MSTWENKLIHNMYCSLVLTKHFSSSNIAVQMVSHTDHRLHLFSPLSTLWYSSFSPNRVETVSIIIMTACCGRVPMASPAWTASTVWAVLPWRPMWPQHLLFSSRTLNKQQVGRRLLCYCAFFGTVLPVMVVDVDERWLRWCQTGP